MRHQLKILSGLCLLLCTVGCSGDDGGSDDGGSDDGGTDDGGTDDGGTDDGGTDDGGTDDGGTDTGGSDDGGTDTGGTGGTGLLGRIGDATADGSDPEHLSYTGTEEWYLIADEGEGEDVCRVRYTLSSTTVRTDCEDCSWAFDMAVSGVEVVGETDPGCAAALGADESTLSALEGSTVSYGYIHEYLGHANVLAQDSGSGWIPVDNATWNETSGAFSYDWQDGFVSY